MFIIFGGVFYVVTLLFGFFCWCRGFFHRTESNLFIFLLSIKYCCCERFCIQKGYTHCPRAPGLTLEYLYSGFRIGPDRHSNDFTLPLLTLTVNNCLFIHSYMQVLFNWSFIRVRGRFQGELWSCKTCVRMVFGL